MIEKNSQFRKLTLIAVSLLVLSFVSACSSTSDSQSLSGEISQAALAASNHLPAELPKVEAPNQKGAPALKTEQQVEPFDLVAPENSSGEPIEGNIETNPSNPSAAMELAVPSPIETFPTSIPEIQENIPPAVDLSLAIEPRVGFRAPEFSLQTVDGQSFRLGDLIGKSVVVNYWATWCVPCKQELPILEKLHREYLDKGVVFISVNALDQDSLDNVQATIHEYGMTFPVLLDQNRQFADSYQAIFFPTTFMIDASGVIREISLGDNTEEELRASLTRLLSGSF